MGQDGCCSKHVRLHFCPQRRVKVGVGQWFGFVAVGAKCCLWWVAWYPLVVVPLEEVLPSTFVQAGGGIVWSGGTPLVVMARLSFSSFGVVCSARFLWYSSSASGLVASDVLLEDLCGNFVSTWCLLFRLRSATSRLLEFFLLIHASRLFQKMTRASLDSIPENAVFCRIPVQINGSKS